MKIFESFKENIVREDTITINNKKWEFSKESTKHKDLVKKVIDLLNSTTYIGKELLDEKSNKKAEDGGTYTLTEFSNAVFTRRAKENAKKKFLKENSDGWWSYTLEKSVGSDEAELLISFIEDDYSIYNFFNKETNPYNIYVKKLFSVQEEVSSSNIYDRMGAKSFDIIEFGFSVKKYGKEPIHIKSNYIVNSTLSQSDIRGFM